MSWVDWFCIVAFVLAMIVLSLSVFRRGTLLQTSYRQARRLVVLLVGMSVVLVGIALLVLPGPAMVVIPIGLGILAVEFAWARRWLKKMKSLAGDMVDRVDQRIRGDRDLDSCDDSSNKSK